MLRKKYILLTGVHPDPEIGRGWGGGRSPKNVFQPFGAQFGLKIRERGPRAFPGPGSATDVLRILAHVIMKCLLINSYIL